MSVENMSMIAISECFEYVQKVSDTCMEYGEYLGHKQFISGMYASCSIMMFVLLFAFIAFKEEVFEEFSKIAKKMNLTFEDTVWYQKVKEKVLK